MMLYLALFLALATAVTPTPGCVAGVCTLQLNIDFRGFGPDLGLAVSGENQEFQAVNYQRVGGQNQAYYIRVGTSPSNVVLVFREGATVYTTSVSVDPQDQSSYIQTVTTHRATLTIDLVGYNPANNGNDNVFNPLRLPSFAGNNWGVQLQKGTEPFREYRPSSLPSANCGLPNFIPLDEFDNLAAMPWTTESTVVVLPDTNIRVKITEGFDSTCTSQPAIFVICHPDNQAQTNIFDSDCSYDQVGAPGAVCNAGLCVSQAIIDSRCNWNAIPFNAPVTRRGIPETGEFLNMTLSVRVSQAQDIFGGSVYRSAPMLPFGFRYTPVILAIGFYDAETTYPSGAANPARLSTIGTSCTAPAGSCEFKALTTIAVIDVGVNPAEVTLSQDGTIIGGVNTRMTGLNAYCALNLPVDATAVYTGNVPVTIRDVSCASTEQYCLLDPFYTWVTPDWDCFADATGLTDEAYPTSGIQFFVYWQQNPFGPVDTSLVTYPVAQPPAFLSTPLAEEYLEFQVPNVAAGQLVLRVQEGACGDGAGANLVGCAFVDFNLTSTVGGNYTTDTVGRILSAFELFYLPADNQVSVNLLTAPAMDRFRLIEDQGGMPRCYCVLPIVLQARITENDQACWKSRNVSCVEKFRPEEQDDCELCDFLSILTVDLRGLPTMTTNGVLFTSSLDGSQQPWFVEDFDVIPANTWTPNPPTLRAEGDNNLLQVFQTSGPNGPTGATGPSVPTGNTVSFITVVPQLTENAIIAFDAKAFGSTPQNRVTGDIIVVGSVSGSLLSAGDSTINMDPAELTPNQTPSLRVVGGETLTVTFRATNAGASATNTPLIDNLSVSGVQYTLSQVRPLLQIGNANNNITVLRSCQCDTPQQYWVEITDNVQAVKTLSASCCDKACTKFRDPFVRRLCLDLEDPAMVLDPTMQTCEAGQHPWPAGVIVYGEPPVPGSVPEEIDLSNWFNPTSPKDNWQSTQYDGCGYSIRNLLTTEIAIPGAEATPFRTRARQGGYNGCERMDLCEEYGSCDFPSTLPILTGLRNEHYVSSERDYQDSYFNGNSWYSVLCLDYSVTLSEYTISKTTPVDCTRTGSCRSAEILVSKLEVDTECEGTPDSQQPQLHSGDLMQLHIVANSSWPNQVLVPDAANGQYPGIGFDITLTNGAGEQFRGKRSKLFLPNCTFDRWTWSSPTCLDCGYRQNLFSVLAVPSVGVRVSEVPYARRTYQYPDTRVTPTKITYVDCQSATCASSLGALFSRLWVQSLRGPPNWANNLFPYMVLKFGDNVETGLRLIHESWFFTDTTPNPICVIADERSEYAINWGEWASNRAGLEFSDCSSLQDSTINNCRTPGSANQLGAIVVPAQKKGEQSPVMSKQMKELADQVNQK